MATLHDALTGLGFQLNAETWVGREGDDTGEYFTDLPNGTFACLYVTGHYDVPRSWDDAVTFEQVNDDDAVDGGALPNEWTYFDTAREFVEWYGATFGGEG